MKRSTPELDRLILLRARDNARRRGSPTIRRGDVTEAERHHEARLSMGSDRKVTR